MFKKGFLVFSVCSQVALVGLLCYVICFKESKSELVADIFDNVSFQFEASNEEQQSHQSWIELEGTITLKDGYIEVKSCSEGIVSDVLVAPGSIVKKGDPLYKISSTKALLQLKESECYCAIAKAELASQKKPCTYALLKKKKEIEEIKLQQAMDQKMFFAFNHLLSKKAASVFEKEETNIALTKTTNKLENALAEYEYMEKGLAKSQEAVFNKKIEIRETKVKQRLLQLQNCIVKAPSDGSIIDVNVKKGEYTHNRDQKNILFAKSCDKVIFAKLKERALARIDLSTDLCGYAVAKHNPQKKIALKFLSCNPRMVVNKNGEKELHVTFLIKECPKDILLEQTFSIFIETKN